MRRTAESAAWRLWPGVRLKVSNDQVFAHGGHVEQLTAMSDVIEITGDDEFLLHGRTADLVNVAGKRSSFGYLNAQLNAIPGVIDGVFFLRDGATGSTGVARLGAVVVAPDLERRRTDRTSAPADRSGVPAAAVDHGRALAAQRDRQAAAAGTAASGRSSLAERTNRHERAGGCTRAQPDRDPADHPSFAGHFPKFPVLPGAVLLDEALQAIEQRARHRSYAIGTSRPPNFSTRCAPAMHCAWSTTPRTAA